MGTNDLATHSHSHVVLNQGDPIGREIVPVTALIGSRAVLTTRGDSNEEIFMCQVYAQKPEEGGDVEALIVDIGNRQMLLRRGNLLRIGKGDGNNTADYIGNATAHMDSTHCTVYWEGDSLVVSDMNSTNGTFFKLVDANYEKPQHDISGGEKKAKRSPLQEVLDVTRGIIKDLANRCVF